MDFFAVMDASPFDFTFLKEAGIFSPPTACTPMTGGANNRVFRLDFENDPSLILKSYFQHPLDPRARLKAEFEFLKFAMEQGIDCLPKPLYQNAKKNIALYSYIKGAPATALDANASFVSASANFLCALNRNKKEGKHLAFASENCSTVEDYFLAVERRLLKLLAVPEPSLQKFLHTELLPQWSRIKEAQCKTALQVLSPSAEDFILTPSDFGLHNALIYPNNLKSFFLDCANSSGCSDISATKKYCFIDFEYAGWDDPVKTMCDFFLQPKIPIPHSYFNMFAEQVASLSHHKDKTLERAKVMFPVCKIKWCCIILNVFLDTEQARRRFAATNLAFSKEKQLLCARNYLFSTPTDQR